MSEYGGFRCKTLRLSGCGFTFLIDFWGVLGDRRAAQVSRETLFYGFSLEEHVPADHLLRSLHRFVDSGDARTKLAPFYSSTDRPSVDPVSLIRMLIVGYCGGIRSERRRLRRSGS